MMRGWSGTALRRCAPIGVSIALALLLADCSNGVDSRYGVSASPRVVSDGDAVPKGGGVYRVGAPYVVGGRTYVPQDNPHYQAEGLASWYGDDFHGRMTANGEVFDLNSISAAHPTLPLPSYVRVTNLSNGRSIIVRVNDRGPFHGDRIIDVSFRTAHLLGFQPAAPPGCGWNMPGAPRSRVRTTGYWRRRSARTSRLRRRIRSGSRRRPPSRRPQRLRCRAIPVSPAPRLTTPAPCPIRAMGYAAPRPDGVDGTVQILNGRGLY